MKRILAGVGLGALIIFSIMYAKLTVDAAWHEESIIIFVIYLAAILFVSQYDKRV